MTLTATHTLEVARGVAPGLVGDDAWRRIRDAAGHLPAGLLRGFYLECRLRPRAPAVDWIVRVEEAGRDILAGTNPAQRLPPTLRGDRVWERLRAFCAAWAGEPRLAALVDHAWLEFDLEEDASLPRPSVFVALAREAARGLSPAGWEALLDRLLALLGPTPAGTRRAAHALLRAAVAAGSGIPYLGFMLARPPGAVRVYLAAPAPATLPRRLRALGWPGPPDELAALLERAGGPAAPEISMVHLDAEDGVLPRAGVEFRFQRPPQLRGALAERAFVDRLVEEGLCDAGKRDGLLAWPGYSVQTLRHELWRSVVVRRVNCVKLVHTPGAQPEAKGYLLSEWSPARPRAARASPASIG